MKKSLLLVLALLMSVSSFALDKDSMKQLADLDREILETSRTYESKVESLESTYFSHDEGKIVATMMNIIDSNLKELKNNLKNVESDLDANNLDIESMNKLIDQTQILIQEL